ncbi:hypothetical protein PG990_005847 [Apiospora arundinis]|uniref:Mid2 domain-containing protein n=1 Tax=Apiospora arundinis TaxID=335852 RepID=A0ABR2J8U6_9PEZI
MRRIQSVLRACSLAAALAITTTDAMSITPNPIFERVDTCGSGNLAKCTQAGLPGNFCCEKGSSCIPLAGQTTVLCCPNGPDGCTVIAPIVCDLKLQDPASNPSAQVKTTVLNGKLPTCGNNCCPYGYSCGDDGNCIMDQDQSKKPEGAKPAPTSTGAPNSSVPSPTSKPPASATSDASPSTIPTAAPAPETSETAAPNTLSTGAVVGGAIGGVLAFAAIVIGFLLYRRRKQKKDMGDSGSLGGRSTSSLRHRGSDFHCIGEPPMRGPRGINISKPLGTTVQGHQWYDESIAQNTLSNRSTPVSHNHGTFQSPHHRQVPPHPSENPFMSRGSTGSWESGGRSRHVSAEPLPLKQGSREVSPDAGDPLRGTINVGLDFPMSSSRRVSDNASLHEHAYGQGVLNYLQNGEKYDRSSKSPSDRDLGRESHYPDEYDSDAQQQQQRPPMPPMPPSATLRPPQQGGGGKGYSLGRNLTAPESRDGKRPETTWEIIQREAGGGK